MNENIPRNKRLFRWRDRAKSFRYAIQGIAHAWEGEHNLRIHFGIALCVIVAGLVLCVSALEWAVLAMAIGMVLASELFNSAIEELSDRVWPEIDPVAGHVKDLAAGAVLLCALAAAAAGLLIFVPKLL